METDILFGGIGVISAFFCGASLVVLAKMGVRRRAVAVRMVDGANSGWLSWLVRNGVRWMRPVARVLMKAKGITPLVQEGEWALAARGWETTHEALLSVGVTVLVAVGLVAGLATRSLVCGLAVVGCLCACVVAWLKTLQDKRRDALRDAVPEALRSMGVCFQSGLSLLQTFQHIARETAGPLHTLFERAAHQLEVGQSADDALAILRSGSSVPELAFVAVALDVQHQAGGSMRRVLEAARETVESQIELRRSLRVQTAQARLSARVVSIMPFVLVALFSLISEGFLTPFFESPLGLALLGIALGMQVAGIMIVRQTLKVDVG